MSDIVDQGNEAAEIFNRAALSNSRKAEGPEPADECLHCGNPTDLGARWCSAYCRNAWQHTVERAKQNASFDGSD